MLVPINITGGTYKHKSLPLSAQVTRNFWPQKQEEDSEKSPYVLESFYGQLLFGTVAGGVDRGAFTHKDILYKVTGTHLYTVSSAGVHTSKGSIAGSGRCIFAPIGDYLAISADSVRYLYDGATVAVITDGDLEAGDSVAHLNNQILFDGTGGRFCTSDVGAATSINALNYATAESSADNLQRIFVHNQTAYMIGTETTEPWWNSGVGSPPYDRIENGIIQIGTQAIYSAANNKNYLYLLGHDKQVYAISSPGNATVVSNPALAREIANYTTTSDAIGWCMTLNSQDFYVLTFPTENKTFIYPEGGQWFEWSSGVLGGRNIANSYVYAFSKHLVADYANGNIYELTEDAYDENGSRIVRVRDTGPIHGGLINKPGKTLTMNRFELIMETGVGLISGQGSNPVVMLSFSDDGGFTFSNEMWGTIGTMANKQWKVEWNALGSFESRIMRVSISDPVHCCIYSAGADIEVGI